ncbi:MAG TPA: hypothetical protein VFQ88_07820 [Nevskiaceae bacterium]|nr:hypothetical protein [Nevskiaceae bacterium]
MKSEEQVLRLCPKAFLSEHHGTFVGGGTRYEIKTGPRKVIGMGMRRIDAWADALRTLRKIAAPHHSRHEEVSLAGGSAGRNTAYVTLPPAKRCASRKLDGGAAAAEVKRLRAQVSVLRAALQPMVDGTHWIEPAGVERARRALGSAHKVSNA